MGELCNKLGPDVYANCRETVMAGVHGNLERQPLDEAGQAEQQEAERIREKLAAGEKVSG